MKIAMMCLWNAANGASIHAKLVGRAWVKLGHQLRVFSAKKHPDARPNFQEDEGFVIRHFSVDEVIPVTRATSFDASPLLESDYQVFVAQNVERLPAAKYLKSIRMLRRKPLPSRLSTRVNRRKTLSTTSLTGMLSSVSIRDTKTTWLNRFLLKGST